MSHSQNDESDDPKDEGVGGGGPNFAPDPIVRELNPGGDDMHGSVSLAGYVGPSRTSGNIRLYTDLSFNTYYELATTAVVSRSRVNKSDDDSPSVLRIRGDSRLQLVNVSSRTVEAGALDGTICREHFPTAARGAHGMTPGVQGFTSDPNVCTGLACYTISVAFCAQAQPGAGRGPVGMLGGFTSDPNVCTGLACYTISVAFCAQAQPGVGRAMNQCPPATVLCLTVAGFCPPSS